MTNISSPLFHPAPWSGFLCCCGGGVFSLCFVVVVYLFGFFVLFGLFFWLCVVVFFVYVCVFSLFSGAGGKRESVCPTLHHSAFVTNLCLTSSSQELLLFLPHS